MRCLLVEPVAGPASAACSLLQARLHLNARFAIHPMTGLVKKGSNIPAEELEAIMANADIDGDGRIDYQASRLQILHSSPPTKPC